MKNKNTLKHFTQTTIKGLFWLLPIILIAVLILWIYNKIDTLVNFSLNFVGFSPENNEFLWFILVIFIFIAILYFVGHLVSTKLAIFLDRLLSKIPAYDTIKDIIGIFNSSKEGENQVLVVAIRGFANEGYNIGLMYSQKESIIKDHYTVTLSMTPIPNGGYMFEVHKDNIFIIENATFDDNLQYLLSMGVKSMTDILKINPKELTEFKTLDSWLKK